MHRKMFSEAAYLLFNSTSPQSSSDSVISYPSTSTVTYASMTFTIGVTPWGPMNVSAPMTTSKTNSSAHAVKGATHADVASATSSATVSTSMSTSQAHRINAEPQGSLYSTLLFSLVVAILVSFVFGML